MLQIFDEVEGTGNETSRGSQCLSHRAHLNFDAILHPKLMHPTSSMRTKDTRGMSLIHHEPCFIPILELNDGRDRRGIPIHGVDGLDHHTDTTALGSWSLRHGFTSPGQPLFKLFQVIVSKKL